MCNFSDRVATNVLTILNQFLPFTLFFELKNQNFQKMKKKKRKMPGDIIILHTCTKNHDYISDVSKGSLGILFHQGN